MAFVNVKLTVAQREELHKMKIKNPYGSYRDITEGIMPTHLTIDRITGTWLTSCYTHHDTSEDIEEFIFMYKSKPIPVQAIQKISKQQVCCEITRIDIPQSIINDKEQFRIALTDAFKSYNLSGWLGEENGQVEVIYNMLGEKGNCCDNGETLRLGFIDFWQKMVYNVVVRSMSFRRQDNLGEGIYYVICV